MGFSLEEPAAKFLLVRYPGGEATRPYYQDAAIRAVLEKVARCVKLNQPNRALLALATGSGKTFIAVNLLQSIAGAGQLRWALFVCDRDTRQVRGILPAAAGPRGRRKKSWPVSREQIEASNFDLKAVNPHAPQEEDTRMPEELLDLIEAEGREVAEAIAALRAMCRRKS